MTGERLSAPRVISPLPGELSEPERRIYDAFTTGERTPATSDFSLIGPDGRLQGPPSIWLLSLPVASVLERLGHTVRFQLRFTRRAHEIAILLAAYAAGSSYEIYMHRGAGLKAGLSESEIEAIASGAKPDGLSDEEEVVYALTASLIANRTLSDEEYSRGVAALSEAGVLELVTLIGYYQMVAMQLMVFNVNGPEA